MGGEPEGPVGVTDRKKSGYYRTWRAKWDSEIAVRGYMYQVFWDRLLSEVRDEDRPQFKGQVSVPAGCVLTSYKQIRKWLRLRRGRGFEAPMTSTIDTMLRELKKMGMISTKPTTIGPTAMVMITLLNRVDWAGGEFNNLDINPDDDPDGEMSPWEDNDPDDDPEHSDSKTLTLSSDSEVHRTTTSTPEVGTGSGAVDGPGGQGGVGYDKPDTGPTRIGDALKGKGLLLPDQEAETRRSSHRADALQRDIIDTLAWATAFQPWVSLKLDRWFEQAPWLTDELILTAIGQAAEDIRAAGARWIYIVGSEKSPGLIGNLIKRQGRIAKNEEAVEQQRRQQLKSQRERSQQWRKALA